MVVAAMKHMASNFAKLDKFEGVDFRRWQKKMHFLLFSMSVVYVLTTSIPEDGDDATVEQLRKRAKWDNDDYVCMGLILNGMSDSLFNIYQSVESSKELWDSLEAKYMAEDASSKACHLDKQNPRCLEDWENFDFQDLVVDGECFQVEVVDFENQKVVERHVVVEMDYKCPVANYSWFKRRDHLVTFEVEEVLKCVLLLEMDLDRA
ncbi:hypothetical protein Tco_1110214 [Tanacetum coccineum]|uniref:Zinc finger, CCHC-type n=1 Tax=Tanacetum coccineum TaxID=301880 RepID=A0ABQ5II62_9ASTR